LAEREDSIHIKIKIDVDEEDRAFQENLASNLAKADEQRGVKKVQKGEETSEETQKEIENLEKEIKKVQEGTKPNEKTQKEIERLEKEIKEIEKRIKKGDPKDPEIIKAKLDRKKLRLQNKELRDGPVGVVHSFTQEQTANLRKFVTNPGSFLVAGITKILGKYGGAASKAGIYGVIALLVYESVMFVIDQLMAPGRPLDRRFKRIARLETMNFYERTLQEEIRHGYQEIRVSTMPGLRGGQSQVNGNLFEFSSGSTGIIQSSPYRSSQEIYRSQNASGSVTDTQGNPRRRSVSSTRYG